MKKILVFLLLLIVILNSCGDSGTNPNEQLKDPRDMTWTADTLKMPDTAIQLLPEDMLVISPNNIWLAVWVGHGQLWHYNGKSWNVVEDIGGGINCLTKKSNTDLWAGGYIGRYYGNNVAVANYKNGIWNWNEMTVKGEILDMSTDPQGNVWACGREGLVMKYSNNEWIVDTIKIKLSTDVSYWLQGIENHDGQTNVLASTVNNTTLIETYYYFSGNLKSFTLQDSAKLGSGDNRKWGYRKLYSGSFGELYSLGLGGIWQRQNNSWLKVLSVSGSIRGMFGVSSNYIIAAGDFKKLMYNNGSSWMNISDALKFEDPFFVFTNVWTDGLEIYVCGYGTINNKDITILWHGK